MAPVRINMLVVGIDPRTSEAVRVAIEMYLRQEGEWEVTLTAAATFKDAVKEAQEIDDLELVYVTNELRLSRTQLGQGCVELAEYLPSHPNEPWMVFNDASYNFLATPFTRVGIRVLVCHVSEAIRERCRILVRPAQIS